MANETAGLPTPKSAFDAVEWAELMARDLGPGVDRAKLDAWIHHIIETHYEACGDLVDYGT